MTIYADLTAWNDEFTRLRRQFHSNPELGFEEHQTSAKIAEQLRSYGVDAIETNWAKTGLVALIHGKNGASQEKSIALRSDIDALPIPEQTGASYASKIPGKMHACGHDGHIAMLLSAAKYLAKNRNFDGTAVLVFQPAEEVGGTESGGSLFIQEDFFGKHPVKSVWGMHNWPNTPLGTIGMCAGPVTAATDELSIVIHGKGGHAAWPHHSVDPVIIGAQLVLALQTIISRNTDPLKEAVISVTCFNIGEADNVIMDRADLKGTIRSFDPEIRAMLHRRVAEICAGMAAAFGARIDCHIGKGYPASVNSVAETAFAANIARDLVGDKNVDDAVNPSMGGEDFAYMLQKRPGCYIRLGTGKTVNDPGLHHPKFDFNDAAIPLGASYWVRLVETLLPI